mgnify:CR=1 FL=1
MQYKKNRFNTNVIFRKIYYIYVYTINMFKNADKMEIVRAFQKPMKIDKKDDHLLKKIKIKKELKKILKM